MVFTNAGNPLRSICRNHRPWLSPVFDDTDEGPSGSILHWNYEYSSEPSLDTTKLPLSFEHPSAVIFFSSQTWLRRVRRYCLIRQVKDKLSSLCMKCTRTEVVKKYLKRARINMAYI